jgi:hypothetical protein
MVRSGATVVVVVVVVVSPPSLVLVVVAVLSASTSGRETVRFEIDDDGLSASAIVIAALSATSLKMIV